jgi:hypothetical protein
MQVLHKIKRYIPDVTRAGAVFITLAKGMNIDNTLQYHILHTQIQVKKLCNDHPPPSSAEVHEKE